MLLCEADTLVNYPKPFNLRQRRTTQRQLALRRWRPDNLNADLIIR